jgi:hypothetical protein
MNLQRYVSTVYTERIKFRKEINNKYVDTEYGTQMNGLIKKFDDESIRIGFDTPMYSPFVDIQGDYLKERKFLYPKKTYYPESDKDYDNEKKIDDEIYNIEEKLKEINPDKEYIEQRELEIKKNEKELTDIENKKPDKEESLPRWNSEIKKKKEEIKNKKEKLSFIKKNSNNPNKKLIEELNEKLKKKKEELSVINAKISKHNIIRDKKHFLLHDLFFEKIIGNTLNRLEKRSINTVFLFPVYKENKNPQNTLLPELIDYYSRLINSQTDQEFFRKPWDPLWKSTPSDGNFPIRIDNGNLILFYPCFLEDDEEDEEYKGRLTSYFERAFNYIIEQRSSDKKEKKTIEISNYKIRDIATLERVEKTNAFAKLEGITYIVDPSGVPFTEYYKKKLKKSRGKILKDIVEKFVTKLGCRLPTIIDPIKKLTKEETLKRFKSAYPMGDKEKKLVDLFEPILETFLDIYKKSNDDEYLKLASSRESQTYYRIYYRVHNTDIDDTYDEVLAGSTHVYRLILDLKNKEEKLGYFKERKGSTNQYIFREYAGLSSASKKGFLYKIEEKRGKLTEEEKEKKKKEIEEEKQKKEEDEVDFIEDIKEEDEKELIIEVKRIGGRLRVKKVTANDFTDEYPGEVDYVKNLHIYEKYKWFQFNELDGTLPAESKIKFYKNIRFDKESFVSFLKSKKDYDPKKRVAVEFLKINQSDSLLGEYVAYLYKTYKDSHFYKESFFTRSIDPFVEKTKKTIADLLFQSNELLYTSGQKSESSKTDIKKNYKMIGHQYFNVGREKVKDKKGLQPYKTDEVSNYFKSVIFDGLEKNYCKRKVCDIQVEIKKNDTVSSNTDYSIVIVDITKENAEVVSELKEKARCKRLRKTIRRGFKPILNALLPRFYGGRLTRRKNRH